MIPKSILVQGAPVVYGWLTYHAPRASYMGLTYGHWTYGERPDGTYGAIEHPTGLKLKQLAQRLFLLRNKVGRMLTLYDGKYIPWQGV